MELLQVYLWKALNGEPQQLTWSLMKDGELQYFDLLVKTISVDERTKLVLTLQDENSCGGKITSSEAELARLDAALEERSEFIEIIMDHLPIGLVGPLPRCPDHSVSQSQNRRDPRLET